MAAAVVLALALAVCARPAAAACPDCDGDGQVSIGDLVTGVGIALGTAAISACAAMDRNGDGTVGVDELIGAINAALGGCPPAPSPTPTATPAPGAVPTEPTALLAWLESGAYLDWRRESAPHQSAGPHGGIVRTYLNDALFTSLDEARPSHPAGAVAVKELYFGGTSVRGWAVMVKVQGDSAGGRGWYWYEYFGSGAPYSGTGLAICTGCHSSGRDYVRIPFPLQ